MPGSHQYSSPARFDDAAMIDFMRRAGLALAAIGMAKGVVAMMVELLPSFRLAVAALVGLCK